MDSLLALTMGDACGIGPEIIASLFRAGQGRGCVVLGDVAVMRRAAAVTGGLLAVAAIESPADAANAPPMCVPVLPVPGLPLRPKRLPRAVNRGIRPRKSGITMPLST